MGRDVAAPANQGRLDHRGRPGQQAARSSLMAHSPGTAVMIGWKVSYLRKTDDGFGFAALGLQEDGGLDEFDVDCWARDGTSGFHAFRLGERDGQTEWTPVRRGTAVILRVELGAMREPDQM